MLAKLASSNPAAYQATLDVVVRTLDDPSILGMKGRSMNIFSTHPYEILIVLIVLAVIILAVSAAILLIRFSSDRCWRASSPGACTLEAIKRIRLLRRADGNYAQFVLNADRRVSAEPTGSAIGIDLGLAHIYTDSDGHEKDNPRLLRRSESACAPAQRCLSQGERIKEQGKSTKPVGQEVLAGRAAA